MLFAYLSSKSLFLTVRNKDKTDMHQVLLPENIDIFYTQNKILVEVALGH